MALAVAAIFFLSGAAGLLFETLWFRQAGLVFGNSFWASSIVLSSFMAGLGLGNGLAARFGPGVRDPLRAYAVLEVGIGVSGAALVFGLPQLTQAFTGLLRPFLAEPWLLHPLRLACAFCLLALPATAMGATLPLLVRVLSARDAVFGSVLGRLYGWNTFGAVVGAVIGELALLAWLGVRGTALAAAGANFAAAAGALVLGSRLAPGAPPAAPKPRVQLSSRAWRCLLAAALSGALLLALEVVWFRFLQLFVHSGALAFAMLLAVVLAGIAAGGLVAARWLRGGADPERLAAALACTSGLLVVASYAAFRFALAPFAATYVREIGAILWLAAALMLPASLASGVLFTWIGTALQRELGGETRSAGLLTLANTAGSALGSLAAGFVLLPALGIERSFALLAALYAGVSLLLVGTRGAQQVWAHALAGAALVASLLLFPFGLMRAQYLMHPVSLLGAPEQVVAVREGRTETALYLEKDFLGEPLSYQLVTDGYGMAGTAAEHRRYMKLFVYWPVALHPGLEQALLISYGVGSTAKALTDTRSLERIDVVDISREVLELSNLVYPDPQEHPLLDPRVEVHVEDGRYFLQTTQRRYDLITGEPPPPKVAGVENLYTREYFQLVYDRLAEGGLCTYWLPVHSLTAADGRAIVRAFCDVFEDCSLWTGSRLQWMLVGSRGGLSAPTEEHFSRQWRDPVAAPELRRLALEVPEQLGATFIADAEQLREMAGDTPPLVDGFPKRLEDGLFAERGSALPLAEWGLDVGASQRRFRESEAIGRLWPPALRERSLEWFERQALVNAAGNLGKGNPFSRIRALDRLLRDTQLTELPLRVLGSEGDRVAIAQRLAAAGRGDRAVRELLGLHALASRDFTRAAAELSAARADGLRSPEAAYWEIYALCMAERCEEGLALARELRTALPDGAVERRLWQWLKVRFEKPFPVAPPRSG